MQKTEYVGLVQKGGHLETADRAQVAIEAVIETLGESLTDGEAEEMATQLPDELAVTVEYPDHDSAGYDADQFTDRVREQLCVRGTDTEPDDAKHYTAASAGQIPNPTTLSATLMLSPTPLQSRSRRGNYRT